MKFKQIIASVIASVMVSTTALSITTSAGNYTRVSVHDPSIVKLKDGSYFIIGSHLGAARSSDLMNWTSAANSYLGSTRTTFLIIYILILPFLKNGRTPARTMISREIYGRLI